MTGNAVLRGAEPPTVFRDSLATTVRDRDHSHGEERLLTTGLPLGGPWRARPSRLRRGHACAAGADRALEPEALASRRRRVCASPVSERGAHARLRQTLPGAGRRRDVALVR